VSPEREGEKAESSFDAGEIHEAWLDCRRRKRGTSNALRFELSLGKNLLDLQEELNSGRYRPTRFVCFITLKPKPREIFAADFRDRVVHHLFIRAIEPYWERVFIHDSYACRPGKGTHAAVDRLESFIRSITRGGRRRAWFLQIDIHNFFMSIDRRLLFRMIDDGLRRQFGVPEGKLPLFCEQLGRYRLMRELAQTLICHDASEDYIRKPPAETWRHIAPHKTLFQCPEFKGLPIGNLTSQFFANVYLNSLDQFVKHTLKAHHYVRYVDDAVLLHEERSVLEAWLKDIRRYAEEELLLRLNDQATKLKPVSCGINFLGYVLHSSHRLVRRRVVGNLEERLESYREELVRDDATSGGKIFLFTVNVLERLLAVLNSYFAHLAKSASHGLLSSILGKHAWISRYFRITGFKADRRWKPPRDFHCLANQYGWFRRNWRRAVIFFQVGSHFELFARDAVWANQGLGLRLQTPRFRRFPRVGMPERLAGQFLERTAALGVEVLRVVETGYPLWRLRERFPDILYSIRPPVRQTISAGNLPTQVL
jgi:retron-type reverse transcriptase